MKLRWMLAFTVMVFYVTVYSSAATASHSAAALPTPTRHADIFRCNSQGCAMPSEGSYPHIVIGVFQTTATPQQSEQLFRDMRAQHLWMSLPDDASAFYATLQPVAIKLVDGSSLGVLIGQDEAHVAPSQPGDLVRYSPHTGKYEIPPTDPKARSYWAVDGCVAVLCRANDKMCFSRYVQGVFRHSDGTPISAKTFKPLANGTAIDPQSMLPRAAKASTP